MKLQFQAGLILASLCLSTSALAKAPNFNFSDIQGSAGTGFTDYTVISPKDDIVFDRGIFVTTAAERGFDFLHLYLTFSLGYMEAEGVANYDYTNLSGSTNYTATDVAFRARMMDLGLGLKFKLLEDYWFRPYIEGGATGGYHEVQYTSKRTEIAAQGNDSKSKDAIMGSGLYTEVGAEIQFSERFSIKLAGRLAEAKTKPLETLGDTALDYRTETYYLSALIGF